MTVICPHVPDWAPAHHLQLGLMHTLQGKMSSKEKLATDAIHIEQRPLRDMRKFPIY